MTLRNSLLQRVCLIGMLIIGGVHVSAGGSVITSIATDRARYSPGDSVHCTVSLASAPEGGEIAVKWTHLGIIVAEQRVRVSDAGVAAFTWLPPAADYRGYLGEIAVMQGAAAVDRGTIAVDVSSDWARFPRYGFLSKFPVMSEEAMDAAVKKLNRYHINGLQFYDWHYKHHMPLKGTPELPAAQWNDIANRTIYFSTVNGYIHAAHRYGMRAMAYNLLYGAYSDAGTDGVQLNEWGLYRDQQHATRYFYDLPAGWASDLYFMDPSNELWRNYLYAQEKKVFQALPFDGWHVDQVGDPGPTYTYAGQRVRDADAFESFLAGAKSALNVRLVMNAVNQYGQEGIARAPVDFLYTEVWDPTTSYGGLKTVTEYYGAYQGGASNMVIAGYMNYGLADKKTFFNTPGVLLTDAVIFASGGAHLELGEHMLVHEYFPNSNVTMRPELERQLVSYYDFSVAYQNLLRDSVRSASASLVGPDGMPLSKTDQKGTVWYFARTKGSTQIVHLINLLDAAHTLWRDNLGTQTEPQIRSGVKLAFPADRRVMRLWMATPDSAGGAAFDIPFTQADGRVEFTLPFLKYWDMIVIEYAAEPTPVRKETGKDQSLLLRSQSYPSPFNGAVTIAYTVPGASDISVRIFDAIGREVGSEHRDRVEAGGHSVVWDAAGCSSGMYFYRLTALPLDAAAPLSIVNKLVLAK